MLIEVTMAKKAKKKSYVCAVCGLLKPTFRPAKSGCVCPDCKEEERAHKLHHQQIIDTHNQHVRERRAQVFDKNDMDYIQAIWS